MAIEQNDDGDEEFEREGEVRFGLVRFVEGVAFGKLPLMIIELSLLFFGQDRVFV